MTPDPRCADKRRLAEIVPAAESPAVYGWTDRSGRWVGDRCPAPAVFVRGIFGSGGAGAAVLPAPPAVPLRVATEVIRPAPKLAPLSPWSTPTLRVTVVDGAPIASGLMLGGLPGDPASNRPNRLFCRIEAGEVVEAIDPEWLRRSGQVALRDRLPGGTPPVLGLSVDAGDLPARSAAFARAAGLEVAAFDWLVGSSAWLCCEVNSTPWLGLNWWLGYPPRP